MKPYYDEGGITIYHGEALEVMRSLPTASVDAVITDPPYLLGVASNGRLSGKTGTWADMANAAAWYELWYREAFRLLRAAGSMWTFCNWRSLPVVMMAAMRANIGIASLLVWDKNTLGPAPPFALRPTYELIAVCPKPKFRIPDRRLTDIWQVPWQSHKPTGHPAEKPVELMRRIIRACALPKGSVVLDPFAGSGSTMVAALAEGCLAIGVELEPDYCDMARRRCQEVAAQTALALG